MAGFFKAYNQSLKTRILFMFTTFVIIIICAISAISYYIVYKNIRTSVMTSIEQTSTFINSDLHEMFEASFPIFNVSRDLTTHTFLELSLEADQYEAAKSVGTMLDNALRLNRSTDQIVDINIIGSNGHCYSRKYGYYSLPIPFFSYPIIHTLERISEDYYISSTPIRFHAYDNQNDIVTVVSPIHKIGTNDLYGVMLLDISINALESKLTATRGKSPLTIIDATGNVVINQNPLWQQVNNAEIMHNIQVLPEASGSLTIKPAAQGQEDLIVAYSTLELTGWKVITTVREAELMSELTNIRNLFIITILLTIGMVAIVNDRLSSNIVEPISNLIGLMKKNETGDFDFTLSHDGEDEIAELYNQYDRLLSKIETLLDSLVAEQVNLTKTELKALQAQINPHFLYNTLDAVKWVAEANDTEQVVELTMALSGFYRILLSGGNDFIPLSMEIEHSKSYLMIMGMRYEDILSYEFDLDEDAMPYMVPKITLQPIIENAIYHGIKNLGKPGTLVIQVRHTSDERLVIQIKDSGIGMDEATLSHVRKKIEEPRIHTNESYGLKNIYQRIKLFYGNDAHMTIESALNQGTTVILSIPAKI